MTPSHDTGVLARLRAVAAACTAHLAGRFRLYDDWHRILLRAWSVRLILFAALCEATSTACSFFVDTDNPELRAALSGLSFACTILAVVARLFQQNNLGKQA